MAATTAATTTAATTAANGDRDGRDDGRERRRRPRRGAPEADHPIALKLLDDAKRASEEEGEGGEGGRVGVACDPAGISLSAEYRRVPPVQGAATHGAERLVVVQAFVWLYPDKVQCHSTLHYNYNYICSTYITVLYRYSTVQYSTVQYSTARYGTVQ